MKYPYDTEHPGIRFLFRCFCGLQRMLPYGVQPGEDIVLAPCPRCGASLKGHFTGSGIVEIGELAPQRPYGR